MHFHDATPSDRPSFINLFKQWVFFAVHGACLLVFVTGWSWAAVSVCATSYFVRMFAITGGYHRYFSHRSYKTSRWFQFLLAFLGATAAQKGPIWWASHHRHHHRYSDTPEDAHSPIMHGLYYAHVGWILSSQFLKPRLELVRDLVRFPEIRCLERFHLLPPALFAGAMFGLGALLERFAPQWNTNGWQMLVWGFFVSTVLTYHGTFCINSFVHVFGKRRFKTTDSSRNSLLFALITLGEGWHNNHHFYPGSERQGFYFWEIDITHYVLKVLSWFGLVWDLRSPPARVYAAAEH